MLLNEYGKRVDTKILTEKIIFFGASTRNQRVIDELDLREKVLFFVDSDEKKVGKIWGEYSVKCIDCIAEKKDCVIVSVLIEHVEEVLESVKKYSIPCFFYLEECFNIEKVIKSNQKVLQSTKNYKYIHIFPSQKFFSIFYEMLEERMNISEHLFIIDNWAVEDNDIYKIFKIVERKNIENHNILFFDGIHEVSDIIWEDVNINLIYREQGIQEKLSSVVKIILHSVQFTVKMQKMLIQWIEDFGDKMIWLCWGRDSNYGDEFILKPVMKKIRSGYAPLAQIDEIWNNYGMRVKEAKIGGYAYVPYIDTSEMEDCQDTDCKNILLGYSAYGNIEYGLDLIYRWKDKNIKIYCPLSYGSTSYRDTIIAKGKAMFGDKFIPIIDYMETRIYYQFLNSMDVAVIPVTELAGGTTITYLQSRNIKIYLVQENVKRYRSLGIHAKDIELLKTQSFEEFLEKDESISGNINNDIIVEEWMKVLNDE